jgi:hypothetical protein
VYILVPLFETKRYCRSIARWSAAIGFAFLLVCALIVLRRRQGISRFPDGKDLNAASPVIAASNPSYHGSPKIAKEKVHSIPNVSPHSPLNNPEALVREYCSKFRQACIAGKNTDNRFRVEQNLYYREARLLALAFPDSVEKAATSVALDPNADRLDRNCAIAMMSHLCEVGRTGSMSSLQSLTRDPDSLVADCALASIAVADKEGTRKDLYWDACRRGSLTAFELASLWVDSGTLSEMKILAKNGRHHAEMVLERLEVLASPQWENHLESLLRDPASYNPRDFDWALAVQYLRKSEAITQLLRDRLDRGYQVALTQWRSESGHSQQRSFEQEFSSSAEASHRTGDSHYDDILMTYWYAGGKLRDPEAARLHTFGYACDPKERLEELLAEGR